MTGLDYYSLYSNILRFFCWTGLGFVGEDKLCPNGCVFCWIVPEIGLVAKFKGLPNFVVDDDVSGLGDRLYTLLGGTKGLGDTVYLFFVGING